MTQPIKIAAPFGTTNPATQGFGLGLPAPYVLVYQPGGVAGGNVYTDLTLLQAAAQTILGDVTVQWDTSLAPGPGTIAISGASFNFGTGNVRFVGLTPPSGVSSPAVLALTDCTFAVVPASLRVTDLAITFASNANPLLQVTGTNGGVTIDGTSVPLCTGTQPIVAVGASPAYASIVFAGRARCVGGTTAFAWDATGTGDVWLQDFAVVTLARFAFTGNTVTFNYAAGSQTPSTDWTIATTQLQIADPKGKVYAAVGAATSAGTAAWTTLLDLALPANGSDTWNVSVKGWNASNNGDSFDVDFLKFVGGSVASSPALSPSSPPSNVPIVTGGGSGCNVRVQLTGQHVQVQAQDPGSGAVYDFVATAQVVRRT